MIVALVVGCVVAGGTVGVWLPVDVVPSEDGQAVAGGPRPAPGTVLSTAWGRAMVLTTAAVWGALAARVGVSWELPADLVASAGLVALAVIDVRSRLLPRRIAVPVGVLTVALLGGAAAATDAGGALLRALACAAVAYCGFAALRLAIPRGLGGGDVTVAALVGLVLGWRSVDAVLLGAAAGGVLAVAFALAALAARRVRAESALAYGAFLVAGALLVLLVAPHGRLFA